MGMIQTESPYYQVAPCALCCGGELPGPHFEIDGTSDVWVYSLITKASIEMVSPYEGTAVLGVDNTINFCSVVMAWLGGAKDSGVDRGNKLTYRSPQSATVIPFPATTVPKASTFTLGGATATAVAQTPNNGHQNSPDGPGPDKCSISFDMRTTAPNYVRLQRVCLK